MKSIIKIKMNNMELKVSIPEIPERFKSIDPMRKLILKPKDSGFRKHIIATNIMISLIIWKLKKYLDSFIPFLPYSQLIDIF